MHSPRDRHDEPYTAPYYRGDAFNCPWCGVLAQQTWHDLYAAGFYYTALRTTVYSKCRACKQECLWVGPMLVYPLAHHGPEPATDMPEEVKVLYEEAQSVARVAPRAAALLLRLAISKLMPHIGATGVNLDEDVAQLMRGGFPEELQKALEALRVIGEDAVHPRTLDVRDDTATGSGLFDVVNLLTEVLITQPKRIHELSSRFSQTQHSLIEPSERSPGH